MRNGWDCEFLTNMIIGRQLMRCRDICAERARGIAKGDLHPETGENIEDQWPDFKPANRKMPARTASTSMVRYDTCQIRDTNADLRPDTPRGELKGEYPIWSNGCICISQVPPPACCLVLTGEIRDQT
jgi:hypothetical protein